VIRDTDIEFLHAHVTPAPYAPPRLPTLREAERAHIVRALETAAWNKKEAARILEISRGTLYRKIVEYGLEPEAKRLERGPPVSPRRQFRIGNFCHHLCEWPVQSLHTRTLNCTAQPPVAPFQSIPKPLPRLGLRALTAPHG
jgi:hypothetical protein